MAGGNDEPGSLGADGFVFAGQQSDGFPAGWVGAFAYGVELVRLVRAYAADAHTPLSTRAIRATRFVREREVSEMNNRRSSWMEAFVAAMVMSRAAGA